MGSSSSIVGRSGEFLLRLFNADGSEAELSGNGTRCVAAWLAFSEGLQEVAMSTHGGLRTCHVIEADGPRVSDREPDGRAAGDAAND